MLVRGRAARAGRDDPAAEALRAAAGGVGRGDADARRHPRPRQLADVLRRLPGAALRRDRPRSRSWSPGWCCSSVGAWFFAHTVSHVQERVDIWLDPWKDPQRVRLPDRAVAVLAGRRRPVRQGPRAGAAQPARRRADPARARHGPDLRRDHRTSSACSARPPWCSTYLLFAERGFRVAVLADDGFPKLLATGLTAVFALQAFVIVGGVTRVIPLTGVTLPFVSYGGSSIVANFVLLALLLMVSTRRARRGAPAAGGGRLGMNRAASESVRAGRAPVRGADRLYVLLVGLRRRRARGQPREQAAAARAAADPARR